MESQWNNIKKGPQILLVKSRTTDFDQQREKMRRKKEILRGKRRRDARWNLGNIIESSNRKIILCNKKDLNKWSLVASNNNNKNSGYLTADRIYIYCFVLFHLFICVFISYCKRIIVSKKYKFTFFHCLQKVDGKKKSEKKAQTSTRQIQS